MYIKQLARLRTGMMAISLISLSACMVAPINADLDQLAKGKGWLGDLNNVKQLQKEGTTAIEFNTSGESIVWLDGLQFESGSIEFDVKGKSTPRQGSFIGVAFRVLDKKVHDVVYFRPFNFNATNPENKAHAVQYMSEPQWPWYRLRDNKPGQYEQPINPAPNGDAWFHVKLILENRQVKVFVNNSPNASLVVNELTDRPAGSVGLWCNGYGVVANLKVTPAK